MASIYQLVPYLLQVHVKYKPKETRPVDDIDAGGLELKTVLLRILDGMRGVELKDPADGHRKLRLSRIHSGDRTILVEFEPGRSGLRSQIEGASTFERTEKDTEYAPLRYFFYFPKASHAAVLLAEKAGTASCVTMVSKLLMTNFFAILGDISLKISPAVADDVLRRMREEATVKSLVFTRPVSQDGSGRVMHIAGHSVPLEIRARAPRNGRWLWSNLPKGASGSVTKESLLGIIAPELGGDGTEMSLEHLGENWIVSTEVKFKNGATRTLNVESGAAITMSYPIFPEDQTSADHRPDDREFRNGVAVTLASFEGQYGVLPGVDQHCVWEDGAWAAPQGWVPWKVVWDEFGESKQDSP